MKKFCVLCIVFLSLCTEAYPAVKAAVSVSLIDEEVMSYSKFSMASYNRHQKLEASYRKMFMDLISQAGIFEPVEVKQEDILQVHSRQQGSNTNGDYRPSYSRSMTQEDSFSMSDEGYNNFLTGLARQKKCRYVISGTINFDKSLKQNVILETYISLFDSGNKTHQTFFAEGRNASSSARTKKTSKKTSSSNKQALKEQALRDALSNVAEQIRDSITGKPAKVTDNDGYTITINKGRASKVSAGDTYIVQTEADDGMNEIFGSPSESPQMINIAVIRVDKVYEDSSAAYVIKDGGHEGAIRAGDSLRRITSRNAESYIASIAEGRNPTFPDKHPEPKKAAIKPSATSQSASTTPLPELPPGTIRIGVMNFDTKAEDISPSEASTITDLLSRMLSVSDKIAVLERDRIEAIAREHKLTISGITDPETAAQIGKLTGCQYMLIGSVTGVNEIETISGKYIQPTDRSVYIPNVPPGHELSSTGQVLMGLQLLGILLDAAEGEKDNVVTETHEVVADVDARLVNVSTSQIEIALSEKGSASESDVITQDKYGNIKNVEANYGSLHNNALVSAAANLSYKIREALADEKIQIVSVNDGEIIINMGSSSGVQEGDLFCVYSEGQKDGDTEAVIRVTAAEEAFSTAEVAKSIHDSYSPVQGSRLESVMHGDFQKGIWHIKNQRRSIAQERDKMNVSIEDLANSSRRKNRLEASSTDPKKVIRSYGLNSAKEKALVEAHSKAAKGSNAKKKYESYKKLSEADMNDYLAAYNTGKYALDLSMYIEAREWASKALFVNPKYRPAKALIDKIDRTDKE